ncbi:MAG: serine O-acetyltransferase [Porticoccaceae bacterium]|nr:serine O-acetyltransferase [Porticoccaceae bacterium]MEA3300650.1 serine O-acetyltransferase [Pseudomonadota bacterium]HLS97715.1 serine O-acetyltransferase [Porticoccaceae bacterium]
MTVRGNQPTAADGDPLWRELRAEVAEVSREEPALASYFHAAVLSHDSLESALAYALASLLGSEVVPALTLHQVIARGFAADPAIGARMRRDLLAHYERDPACDRRYIPLLYFKGFHALEAHRIAHWLWEQGRRSMAVYLQSRVAEIFAVDIHPAARIGGGVMLDHATGLVVGETAVIGDDVSILHAVTLGGTGKGQGQRHPTIGRGVLIASGAKILGNIAVGEGARIGAGSLVLDPVPAHSTVAGVPARVVGGLMASMPALDMDQRINGGEAGAE